MAKPATTVEEIIQNPQFRLCRVRGHHWVLIRRDWTRKKQRNGRFIVTELEWEESCSCGSTRRSLFEVHGRRLTLAKTRTTTYPDGYPLKGGRLTRAEAFYLAVTYENPELVLTDHE